MTRGPYDTPGNPLAWLASLTLADQQMFLTELVEACTADGGRPADLIAAWRVTAETCADPAAMAALDGPLGDYGPVPEPPAAGED